MGVLAWFPQPKLLPAAGGLVAARELRVMDLAPLEAFAAAYLGSPLDDLQDDADDYPDKLREAYDRALSWPPSITTPEVNHAVFSVREGVALFLSLVLRGVEPERVVELTDYFVAGSETAQAEFSAIERTAWGVREGADYHRQVVNRIDRHLGLPEFDARDDDDFEVAQGDPWEKAIGTVVSTHGWASPEAVGNLTLSQWRMVRCGGDTGEIEDPLPGDSKLNERVCAARREFFGIVTLGLEETLPAIIEGPEEFEGAENFG